MVRYKLEYFLTRFIGFLAKIIPLKLAHSIGDRLGDLFYYLIRIRKKVAYRNLKASFGEDKTDREIKQIIHQNYRHFGRVLMEFARLPLLKRDSILDHIPVRNIGYFSELMGQNKGLIILSGHLGNWEYMAAAVANIVPPVYCVFKQQKNIAVDNIIKDFRIGVGLRPFKVKGGAAKGMLKAVKEKGVVLILNDQDAGRKGEMIDFLGRPASTARGAALIAIKYRVPVILAFGIREKSGSVRIHTEKFPDINQFSNDEQGVKQFLSVYNKILERYIRQYPEQWFWLHRRWKTRGSE